LKSVRTFQGRFRDFVWIIRISLSVGDIEKKQTGEKSLYHFRKEAFYKTTLPTEDEYIEQQTTHVSLFISLCDFPDKQPPNSTFVFKNKNKNNLSIS